MPDGTSIFGTDTSRYQAIGGYDPGAFEIVNIEDPSWLSKWLKNRAEGRPTGFYLWCHPGNDTAADTRWAIDKIRSVGLGDPELGLSLDYEEAGVEEWQIDRWLATRDHMGMKGLLYALPSSVNWAKYPDVEWWACVYPANNDGSFPGYDALWPQSRPRHMHIWQFTSSANAPVGLDRNVIVDEDWYARFAGGIFPVSEDDMNDLIYLMSTNPGVDPAWQVYFDRFRGHMVKSPVTADELDTLSGELFIKTYSTADNGGPHAADPAFINGLPVIEGEPVFALADSDVARIAAAVAARVPAGPGNGEPPFDFGPFRAQLAKVATDLSKLGELVPQ